MSETRRKKRFDINVSDELHRQVKIRIAMLGTNATDYITKLIQADLNKANITERK